MAGPRTFINARKCTGSNLISQGRGGIWPDCAEGDIPRTLTLSLFASLLWIMLPVEVQSGTGETMLKHCLLWLALSATGSAQTLQLESRLVTHNDTLNG